MSSKMKGIITIVLSSIAAAVILIIFFAGRGVAPINKIEKEETKADAVVKEKVKDSAGNEFEAPLNIENLVVLNPNAYDAMKIIGKSSLVKGISTDTASPESNALIEKYGTESNVNIEKLIKDKPDAVIADTEFINTPGYTELKNSGIDIITLDLNKKTKISDEMTVLGKLFDANEKADEFKKDTERVQSLLDDKLKNVSEKKIYWELSNDNKSVGKDANENETFDRARLVNIANSKDGKYVDVDNGYVKDNNPDVIVKLSNYTDGIISYNGLNQESLNTIIDNITKREGWNDITAVKNNNVVILSDRITNSPLGSVLAPMFISKVAYSEEMADINPNEYLNEFMKKYWGTSIDNTLAFAKDANTIDSGDNQVEITGPVTAATVVEPIKKTSTGAAILADTSKPTTVVKDSKGQEIIVNKDSNDGKTMVKKSIVLNSSCYDVIKLLGQEKSVIGVADTTESNLPKYGDWRNPNVEKIIEAKPDVVFGYASWLESGIGKQLSDAGIQLLYFDLYVPSKIPEEIMTIGKILGAEKKAQEFNNDIKQIQNLIAERTKSVNKVSAYWEGYADYKSVGKGSGGNEILNYANVNSLTGGEPVAYPIISDEWILEKNPEVIVKLVSDTKGILGEKVNGTKAAKELYNKIINRPGWKNVKAVSEKKVLIINSTIGTSPLGSGLAPLYIAKIAYPELFKDINPDETLSKMVSKYYGKSLTGVWSYYE